MKLWDKVRVISTQETGIVVEIQAARWPAPANDDRYRVRIGDKFFTFWADEVEKIIEAKQERPPEYILVPIGEYNGVDLPGTWIDEDYTVWLIISNPEANCEVIYDN